MAVAIVICALISKLLDNEYFLSYLPNSYLGEIFVPNKYGKET